MVTQLLVPGAEPRWAADAIAEADVVVLAMPLNRFLRMDPDALSGKLVIDAMNYWPPTDGRLPPPFKNEVIRTIEVVAGVRGARSGTAARRIVAIIGARRAV